MKIPTGRDEGRLGVDGDVSEGQVAGGYRPSIDEEAELAGALDETRSGDYVDGWLLIEELKSELPTSSSPPRSGSPRPRAR